MDDPVVRACALFLLLAYFSLKLFTETERGKHVSDAKRKRNVVFKVCGWTIVGSIVLVAVSNIVDPPNSWNSLFWLETVGVIAFGISWLVKSGIFGLLVDRPSTASSAVAAERARHPTGRRRWRALSRAVKVGLLRLDVRARCSKWTRCWCADPKSAEAAPDRSFGAPALGCRPATDAPAWCHHRGATARRSWGR